MATHKITARKKKSSGRKAQSSGRKTPSPGRKWSARVMARSDALDLESGVFTKRSPRQIALSLKHSAEASHRRKASPFQSAMSMLNFHINRSGSGLTAERRRVLNRAKAQLRELFHR